MKKYLEISLLALAGISLFYGCKNDTGDSLGKKQHYQGIDTLFIVNASENTKGMNDSWVYLDADSSRAVETVGNSKSADASYEYSEADNPFKVAEHTVPCIVDISSLGLKTEKERAAEAAEATITTTYKVGEWKDFQDVYGNKSIKHCALRYEGEHCYIWTDRKADEDSALSDEEITTFSEKFDAIYEKETALCGPKYDGTTVYSGVISPCAKISVVLFDIGSDKNSGAVFGYFNAEDFISANYDSSALNSIEAIYVDSYYAKLDDSRPQIYSTLAHEFNHMLNFVNKVLKYNLDWSVWFTEMLSMTTEDILMDDVGISILGSPWSRLGDVFFRRSYNYGFGNWRDIETDQQITLYNYANAFLFGAYLERNYGGAKLIHEIATNEYTGEEAIVKAVNKLNCTNLTFEDLLCEYGYVLVNTENQYENLPSLARGSECKLDDYDFTYTVKPIVPSELLEAFGMSADLELVTDTVEDASDLPLDSYGFQIYQFEEPADIDVRCMNFLTVKTFKK